MPEQMPPQGTEGTEDGAEVLETMYPTDKEMKESEQLFDRFLNAYKKYPRLLRRTIEESTIANNLSKKITPGYIQNTLLQDTFHPVEITKDNRAYFVDLFNQKHLKALGLKPEITHLTDITFDVLPPELQEEFSRQLEIAQKSQSERLKEWLTYILQAEQQPPYIRYIVFRELLGMGVLDPVTYKFFPRDDTTLANFPEFSPEAFAQLCEKLKNYVDIKKIKANRPSVSRIYAEELKKIRNETLLANLEDTTLIENGTWTTYTDVTDADTIVQSLAGWGTHWCIGDKYTVEKNYLEKDATLHIFYDSSQPRPKPRACIVSNQGTITEVRGIIYTTEHKQYLDSSITGTVAEKLQSIPGGEEWMPRMEDMKKLALLCRLKHEWTDDNVRPLFQSREEALRFIYEIDRPIANLGYGRKDPRIETIRTTRDTRADMALIYNCDVTEVAVNVQDITPKTKVYIGDLGPHDAHIFDTREEGITIIGDVDFAGSAIQTLPQGTVFRGDVNFARSAIQTISQGTVFRGDVYFNGSAIETIPRGTVFEGSVNFSNCKQLTSIAPGVVFKKHVDFNGSAIQTIPQGTVFRGDVNFSFSGIRTIPQGTVFGGDVNFSFSAIQTIPQGTVFGGDVDFTNCKQLTSIDPSVTFTGKVYIDKTQKKIFDPLVETGKIKKESLVIE